MPTPVMVAILFALVVGLALLGWRAETKRVRLLFGAGAVLLAGAAVIAWLALPADDHDAWPGWRTRVAASMSSCGKDADQAKCLATALRTNPAPTSLSATPAPSEVFFADVRTGENLEQIPVVRDALWKEFGIDSEEFVGAGYSIDQGNEAARSYNNARQREFLVSNLCADSIDKQLCPHEIGNVWTWRVAGKDINAWLNCPVKALLAGVKPDDHAAEWRRLRGAAPRTSLLIRIARFAPQNYKGTVGRAEANLVFFTPLGDTEGRTLRQAMQATGSAALLSAKDADQTLFIWVYAPAESDAVAPATWRSVFEYLDKLSGQESVTSTAPVATGG